MCLYSSSFVFYRFLIDFWLGYNYPYQSSWVMNCSSQWWKGRLQQHVGKCLHLNPICSGFDPLERLCGALEDARSDAGFFMSSFFCQMLEVDFFPFRCYWYFCWWYICRLGSLMDCTHGKVMISWKVWEVIDVRSVSQSFNPMWLTTTFRNCSMHGKHQKLKMVAILFIRPLLYALWSRKAVTNSGRGIIWYCLYIFGSS